MFKPWHPTETAGSGQSIPHKNLPSEMGIDGDESRFVYCKQCGFIVNSKAKSLRDGDGLVQHSAQVASAVTADDSTITVDSTAGFDSDGTAYIFDMNSERCYNESFTYTGKTSTTFTGCSDVGYDHAVDIYIRDAEDGTDGCGLCHSTAYM